MVLSANQPAPDFTLADETGAMRSLSEFRGKPVVLYFYPKDDTPGCTTEACNFRDDYHVYAENGVVILGVSPDSPKSHAKFKAKYNLPFTLLADENHRVCEMYGVWGRKKFMGREYDGVFRTTFLIDPQGMIVKVWEGVKPEGHSQEVLEALRDWQGASA
ncbi:thioredoxin-dependent thiol peroxidase [Anaerolinea sp.]|uniref:thioredoxin-dependent thiol peroxidase n=1 Tax=Anaerolinea sp. TaxID=1872519 RepID=UPI002ACDB075|nr:thioredoxin-dependent thiol peroxidase [Anaerolinea sp.]